MVIKIHVVGATCMSMNERFTLMNAQAPRRGAAHVRGRRRSFSGPLNQKNLNMLNQRQDLVQEVVRQLELQWERLEQRQRRAGSVGYVGGDFAPPGLWRAASWGNLSRANSVGNLSQRSWRHSQGNLSQHTWRQSQGNLYGGGSERTVSFSSEPGFNLNARGSSRGRRSRGRRGGRNRRGRVSRLNQSQSYQPFQQRQPYQPFQQRQPYQPFQQRGRGRGQGRSALAPAPAAPPMLTRSMARNGGNAACPPRAALKGAVSQSSMPKLLTLEQLDKELDQYMAGTKAALDKELEEYMAQNAMDLD